MRFYFARSAKKIFRFYFARSAENNFRFAGRPPPKKGTFQICREATAQKNAHSTDCTTTREGHPEQLGDVGAYSSTICTTDTGGGGPGQSGDGGGGGEGGGGEEERRKEARPREKTYNLQQTLGNNTMILKQNPRISQIQNFQLLQQQQHHQQQPAFRPAFF